MLDELVSSGRITVQQKEMYLTYTQSDHGRNTLHNMMHDTFMEEPNHPSGVAYAFSDGRRSVCRDITKTLQIVEIELKKGLANDNG